jgi:penicillin-binding protein 2
MIFCVAMLCLLGQLSYLQFIQGDYYSSISEKNYIRTTAVKSARGIIYDRNMEQIVFNVPVFDVVIVPADFFKDRDGIEDKKKAFALALEITDSELGGMIGGMDPTSYQSYIISENIEKEKALIVEEKIKGMAGVRLESSAIRKYTDGKYFSSIVGYSGRINSKELESRPDYLMTDIIGKDGLEYAYEGHLRGIYGITEVEVDSLGRVNRTMQKTDPVAGDNLVLNIDAELQSRLYKDIEEMAIKQEGSTGGSVVAINPQTGAVLALVSYPSYDNNSFAGGISTAEYSALLNDANKPLFNRAIEAEYPPGSTFKPMMAAAALEEKVISPTRTISDGGSISIGGWSFNDWKAHGTVDLVKAIAQSCNVYFYTVGGGYGDIEGLGADRIKKYANLFGMGQLTGIDLPGEKAGLIPDTAWKREVKDEPWYIGDTYHMSIGQGDVLTTPLQIANYTAAVANGGTVYQPQVVDKIVDSVGSIVQDIEPKVLASGFISPENMGWVQKGMLENVLTGSGRALSTLPVQAAGKTGTAQYAGNTKTHAWYTVYAPYENPQIVMAIMLEGGGEGHDASVPIAKDILGWYFGVRVTGASADAAKTGE